MNYYNEIDGGAAALLTELIKAGVIANGIVDTRSIADVTPNDVRGFTQCHFFAGIGGWPLALRLAGWPDDRRAWTGSCPCQPFSQAGKGLGFADERHLWPAWMHLIRQCKPSIVVGEQVASAIRHGWLDTVFDDLENTGYACGAAVLPAASVGAPHIRERVWFVGALADSNGMRSAEHELRSRKRRSAGPHNAADGQGIVGGHAGELADADSLASRQGRALDRGRDYRGDAQQRPGFGSGGESDSGELGNASGARLAGRARLSGNNGQELAPVERASGGAGTLGNADSDRCEPGRIAAARAGFGDSIDTANWNDCAWLACIDDKQRPTQPGLSPLAYGIPRIMGPMLAEFLAMGIDAKNAKRLARTSAGIFRAASTFRNQQIRGYGNAIVPAVAAEFIRSLM